ncbi:uncharacterized protein LOC106779836 isoform X2 [Vigna radiata var. radiata]|uniref:Uncharacterized protein LOC106779836 isoform X2 n=1 Tax=Vigna radiata var. radiata TaxID=3916 RepID=A0A3Q0EKK7_VIGRR|nr:uncharacterized protein LOC106779836 isoform X2 [Vigna radiata var. radiata]
MYPKVKVRHDDDGEIGLKAFLSLYLQPSSPDNKVVAMPSVVRVPECYVLHVAIPRVPVTEDSGDFSVASDSSITTGSDTDENKVNLRVSSIPPPRAVISSPGPLDSPVQDSLRKKPMPEGSSYILHFPPFLIFFRLFEGAYNIVRFHGI